MATTYNTMIMGASYGSLLAIKLLMAPIMSMDLQDLAIAGRALSTLADVGTVALVYALGRRLYGRGAGLLAAALVTFAVIHIQHSHYYRPETFTNLFTLASFCRTDRTEFMTDQSAFTIRQLLFNFMR